MKTKSISLLLIISVILSLFSVYSFATESSVATTSASEPNYAPKQLHYRNSYGDGEDDVGSPISLINASSSYTEVRAESDGNKYGYFNINDNNKNVFFQLQPSQTSGISTEKLGYMIFEMDFNDLGNLLGTNKFLEIHSGTGSFAPNGGRVATTDILNIANDGSSNYLYFKGSKTNRITIPKNEWTHIRCEISILDTSATTYNFKCVVGDKSFESSFKLGSPTVITYIRVGSTNTQNQIFGLDNITLYSGPKNYPTYDTMTSITKGLAMKVGAENALHNGSPIELTYVPLTVNGLTYCPLYILESIVETECPSTYVVVIDGNEYINIDSIPAAFGLKAELHDMGLLLIGDACDYVDSNAGYTEIMDFLKSFVFNIPSADQIISDVQTHTNGFDHPFLLADADRFAELRALYKKGGSSTLSGEEAILYDYIDKFLTTAKSNLNTYFGIAPTGVYKGIKSDKIPVNANYSKYNNNGYDNGGRVSTPPTPHLYFAFAYQITGNLNYARAAYDYMLAIGEWNHWGPSHFLNCADIAAPFAIAYDWLYDAFGELNTNGELSKFDGEIYDKQKLATVLFTHVIIPGYVQSNNLNCPWPGSVESRYATKTSNWNAVCASGVIMSALLLLEEDIPTAGMTFNTQKKNSATSFTQTVTPIESIGNTAIHAGLSTYSDYAAKLSSMNLKTLAQYGLDQYAPDGSYVESPGYWSYGTNTFFRLVASLLSATGDDYGFMDAWGIDTTCYFAVHSESSDFRTWNFNDGSVGVQDSSFFFFVGDYYNDDNLVRIRKHHLSSGKSYSLYDILFYDTSITGEPELDLDYHMVGIDAYSVRSSWEKDGIYAGVIGGANRVSHGHMDAGSFVYRSNGKIWFHDIGADNYNIGIGYFSNFKLYRIGAEGHNLITITSEQDTLPYGQSESANPKIVSTYSDANGGYAVLDMSDSYGSHVIDAKRGLLFADSRNAVVIQDEYIFNGKKTAYWAGHYNLANGYVDDVSISADGRTAFMISGDDILRVSIVSDNSDLRFEIMDTYTYLLDITHKTDRNTMDGPSTETNRDTLRKLVIKCENVERLNLAVVIEEVGGYNLGTEYTWTNIDDWNTSSWEKVNIEDKFKAEFDSDSYNIGSYDLDSSDSSYIVKRYENGLDSYIGVFSDPAYTFGNPSTLKMAFAGNKGIDLKKSNLIAIDFDTFTEGLFIHDASLGINVVRSNGDVQYLPLIHFVGNYILTNSSLHALTKEWVHVTILIDTEEHRVFFVINNKVVATSTPNILEDVVSVSNLQLYLPGVDSVDYNASILLDNVRVRRFSTSYDIDELRNFAENRSSIAAWRDRIYYVNKSIPIASANGNNLYTNAEITTAISNGYDVTLFRDVIGIIDVASPVSIDTNGYNFDYTSSYLAKEVDDVISFYRGAIKVTWHIGTEIRTEYYESSVVAEYKGVSPKIGVISYDVIAADGGGLIYKFYTTGWSNTENGDPISQKDMIVSEQNCDFWLVNRVPLNCAFVTIDAYGKIKAYSSESDLQSMIRSNNGIKNIYLCNDVELTNTSALILATGGKSIYLNGYTLSHRQYDVHTYSYSSSATADFTFIGPGTLEADGSRAMFTSSSSTSDKTSKYGIVVENANIITNMQLADLRVGQHRFINCNLSLFDKGKSAFVDLWNKNTTMNDGVPQNLLTITFDGCVLDCEASALKNLISFTGTSYSEAYFINTQIKTSGNLYVAQNTAVKFNVSGDVNIIAARLSDQASTDYSGVKFGVGVKTNLNIPAENISATAVLANTYSDALPYLVTDEYALVTWVDLSGNVLLSEYLPVGTMPQIKSSVLTKYLSTLGGSFTYNVKPVSDTAPITLAPVRVENIKMFYAMHIQEDLNMYIYIEKSEMEAYVSSVTINDYRVRESEYEIVNVDGVEYYRFIVRGIKPANAFEKIDVCIERIDGKIQRFNLSAVDYLDTLLASSQNRAEKILAVKLLRYIENAYAYFNDAGEIYAEQIRMITEKYKEYDVIFDDLKTEYVATGTIRDAITEASINVSTAARFRFVLNPSYTGDITIEFNGNTYVYSVKSGIYRGQKYIEVFMPADTINDHIVITTYNGSVEYGLNAYVTSLNLSSGSLVDLLRAMSQYSYAAEYYLKNT